MEIKNKQKKKTKADILAWVFFVSKGITDNMILIECLDFCQQFNEKNVTVESVKNSNSFESLKKIIWVELISDKRIQEMIDFNPNKY